jgi:surfeit locus 1 family protein
VTPVRTSAAGEPALLPVVRGFVTDPAQAVPPGPGTVALEGTLAPVESPVGSTGLPAGQRGSIDAADLANAWDEPLFNAFIFLVSEEPALTDPAIERIPPPVFGDTGIVWRNVGYGLQWFVFAGFACYMYYRFVRDVHQARNAADQAEPTPTTTTLRGDPA